MVDSEVLSGQLMANDIRLYMNKKLDTILLLKYMGFIDKAKEDRLNTILDQVDLKRKVTWIKCCYRSVLVNEPQ